MKTLRQLCVASVFVFALAIPAFAGEIQIPLAPPPTPIPTTAGWISTGKEETGGIETTASGSAADVALSLLQSVLSLF
jgi:hypothetical protein